MGLQQYVIFVVTRSKHSQYPWGERKCKIHILKLDLTGIWCLKKDHCVYRVLCFSSIIFWNLKCWKWQFGWKTKALCWKCELRDAYKMRTRITKSIVKSQARRGLVRGLFKQGIPWDEQQHSQDGTLTVDRVRETREVRETSGALCDEKKQEECFKEGRMSLEGSANESWERSVTSVAEDDQPS